LIDEPLSPETRQIRTDGGGRRSGPVIGMNQPLQASPADRTENFYASLAKQFEAQQGRPFGAAPELRQSVAVSAQRAPWLSWGIIAVLIAVFAAELRYGIAQPKGSLDATIWTLHAFGGTTRDLVWTNGEWYRLFSATLLHANLLHLALNCIALHLAGRSLEYVIGSAWLGATFVLGAVAGSLASVMLNPPDLISVGASAAVLALFATMLIVSFHFPPGERRTELRRSSIYVLVLSNVPLASALFGMQVDYAGHFGGAIAGLLIGLSLLRVWPRMEARPRLGRAAMALAVLGSIGFIYPAFPIAIQYPVWAMAPDFAPASELPKSEDEIPGRAADLAARYPRDPRVRAMHASALLQAGDQAGAERELRSALVEEVRWQPLMPAAVSPTVRAMLATILADGRLDEAKQIAQPACSGSVEPEVRKMLDDAKLCAAP
jgi:rhomboid protease GluP